MSDQIAEGILAKEEKALDEIDELFHEDSYYTRITKMIKGFSCSRDSREFKSARIEAQRLAAPLCAVMIPVVAVALLAILATGTSSQNLEVEVEYLKAEEIEELEQEKPLEQEIPEVETEIEIETDVSVPIDTPVAVTSEPVTAQPSAVDTVLQIKSPVIMKGIYGSRNAGMRGQLMKRFGGDEKTEAAVMAALRWLKKNQHADGSWPKNKVAMTGLAILTFLAHGEKPGAESPEFGETVQRAIEFLIKSQTPNGRLTSSYSHAIATYALCEAYGMTMNPNVKDAADKAINVLVVGQNPDGGWCYGLVPEDDSDTSVMGWCAQALKAAQLSNAYYDREALEATIKKSIRGFQRNHRPGGGFGYRGPGAGGLSSVGVLSMQLLGASGSPEVRSTLTMMDAWQPAFLTEDVKGIGGSLQYYYYYATQAKFHAGGKSWETWNEKMKPIYLSALKIEKDAYTDHLGKLRDIGWWENTDDHTDRPVMDTCLTALQLMVYYRNLPTTQASAVREDPTVGAVGGAAAATVGSDDITVDVGNL